MITRLPHRQIAWQSTDGLMQAGTAALTQESVLHLPAGVSVADKGKTFQYSWLGGRPATLDDLKGLRGWMQTLSPELPWLLASSCPGFLPSAEGERDGMVLIAGEIRHLQEEAKAQGLRLVSWIDGAAVGGTYLMHGMAAPNRIATNGTSFYDTVYPGNRVDLSLVLKHGLVTEVLPPHAFPGALETRLFGDV